MKKILMIYDQIQSGIGIKDDHQVPLGLIKEPVGPAIMMEQAFCQNNMKVFCIFYVGDGYFKEHEEDVIIKMEKMIEKIHPDGIICGPAYNYLDYASMCAKITYRIQEDLHLPIVSAMSAENEETIKKYQDKICIIQTPKKGGIGLSDSLNRIVDVLYLKINGQNISEELSQYIYGKA